MSKMHSMLNLWQGSLEIKFKKETQLKIDCKVS